MKFTIFFGCLMFGIMVLSAVMSIFIDISDYVLYIKIAVGIAGVAAFISLLIANNKEE